MPTNTPRREPPQGGFNCNQHESALAVFDGQQHVGDVIEHAGKHHAFTSTGKLVGVFATRLEAMRAVPTVKLVPSITRRSRARR
jgi:hypothetical protein